MNKRSLTSLCLTATLALGGAAFAQQSSTSTGTTGSTTKTTTGTAKPHTATGAKKSTPASPVPLTTPKQKASYAIGTSIGRKIHDDQLDVDTTVLMRGLKDAMAGTKSQLTDDQMRSALMEFQEEAMKNAAAKNKAQGDAYRAANKTKPGVTTLPSGLQYKVVTQGTGPKPTKDDSVVCNYRGTFVDGKEFDSSYKRGEPATFPVTGVIKGWTEALQLMPVGSKWQLVIPPDLAYGEQGRPGMPPNETLVFEVELVKIAEKEKPAPEAPNAQPGNPAATPGGTPAPQHPDAGAPGSAAPQAPASNPSAPQNPASTPTPPPDNNSQPQNHPQK